MATRVEVQKKKTALVDDLRAAYQAGAWRQGDVAVSQRELSSRYELSMRTVGLELQKLVDEGILYTVPRVGTFVGRPQLPNPKCFLYVMPQDSEETHNLMLRLGFEERIAALGGASLSLTVEALDEQLERRRLPEIAGVFGRDRRLAQVLRRGEVGPESLARVRFGKVCDVGAADVEVLRGMDVVDFDNEAAGAQAARHLLEMGYRRVAFVGLHAPGTAPFGGDVMHWSAERAAGWSRMLQQWHVNPEGLLFLPDISGGADHPSQIVAGRQAAERALLHGKLDAIVSVNMFAGNELLDALRMQGKPDSAWPAIVSFDDYQPADTHIMSCFHLPWWAAGAAAADLLWERSHGTLEGPPQIRTVPMRLVRRLTCRQDWSQDASQRGSHWPLTVPSFGGA